MNNLLLYDVLCVQQESTQASMKKYLLKKDRDVEMVVPITTETKRTDGSVQELQGTQTPHNYPHPYIFFNAVF